MENNQSTGKMKPIKTTDTDALNNFFGKKEQISDDIWRVSLMFTKEEEQICRDGFKALPRDKRAMRDYQKDAILDRAKKDIEKGIALQKAMKDLEK